MSKLQGKGLKASHLKFYKHCVIGKQVKVLFRSPLSHPSIFDFDYVHTDIWGSTFVKSHDSDVYFITFIDNFSKKV